MSLSSARRGLLRVLHDDDDGIGGGTPLARWEPVPEPDGYDDNPLASARRAGYAEGYRAALAEAETAVEADRGRVRVALADAARIVARTRVDAVGTLAADAVELALDLTEVILQRELGGYQAEIEAVARALALAPSGDDLVVRVHPDHVVEIGDVEALAPGVTVRIIGDPKIERGGCLVEVGPCRVDAQIGPAIARARALIADGRPGRDRS